MQAVSPSLTSDFTRVLVRWLLLLEAALILLVLGFVASGLRWSFSDPLTGAMVAVSELEHQIALSPSGELILRDASTLDRLERDNPDFWYRISSRSDDIRSRHVDGGVAPPLAIVDHGTVTRVEGTGPRVAVWTSNGDVRIGASGAVTDWGTLLRYLFREVLGYLLPILVAPLIVGGLIIWASRKPIRARLTAIKAPMAPQLARGQRLQTAALPQELASFAESYNVALDCISAASERLESLSGDVAHEFRAPLHRIQARADSLPSGAARDAIAADIRTLADTLNGLLNLAKSGLEGAPRDVFDLSALALGICQELAPAAIRAGRELSFEGSARHDVTSNAALVAIVIRNLVENAIRHTRSGDSIEVRIINAGLQVVDSGCGYVPESDNHSRGLGLRLSERIANHLDAHLDFSETPGGGLTVSLRV